MSHRFERIVLALVVCVPVPAFAVSGLTVPLPSVVERVAAALVPWANASSSLDSRALAGSKVRGAIVLEPGREEPARTDIVTAEHKPGATVRRPRVTRTVVTSSTAAAPRVASDEPETPRVPTTPEHHTDEEATETPTPAEPTTEPTPADDGGGEPPVTHELPAEDPAPAPDPRPKPKPKLEPADEFGPTPTEETNGPTAAEPEPTPVDPGSNPSEEEKPVEEVTDEKPSKPEKPSRRNGADESGTGP